MVSGDMKYQARNGPIWAISGKV